MDLNVIIIEWNWMELLLDGNERSYYLMELYGIIIKWNWKELILNGIKWKYGTEMNGIVIEWIECNYRMVLNGIIF